MFIQEPVPKAICEVAGWGSQESTEKPTISDTFDPLSVVQDILMQNTAGFVKIPDLNRQGTDKLSVLDYES